MQLFNPRYWRRLIAAQWKKGQELEPRERWWLIFGTWESLSFVVVVLIASNPLLATPLAVQTLGGLGVLGLTLYLG